MIVLVAKYYCKPGKGDEMKKYLDEMKPLVEKYEEGCPVYFVNQSEENVDLYLLYEQYVDQQAFEAHWETDHFKEIIEGMIIPLLEKRECEVYRLVE